ncbi:hypothetical protein D3C86_1519250 [compost metagenome]
MIDQHPHELGHHGGLGHPGGLAHDPLELAVGLHPLQPPEGLAAEDGAGQQLGASGMGGQRLVVHIELVDHPGDRRQLAAHIGPLAIQHQAIAAQVLAERGRIFQARFGAARGAPLDQELGTAAKGVRHGHLQYVEELAAVVVDRGGAQQQAPEAGRGQVGTGLIDIGVVIAQLLGLFKHHQLGDGRQFVVPPPQLVVADQDDVRQGVPQILAPLVGLADQRVGLAGADDMDLVLGQELGQLLRPVVRQGGRVNHYAGQGARLDHGHHGLHRLAKAHLIRQQQAA